MLVIRLTRVGKKNQPEYRFIVSEKHKDPWGDALEYLGYYNPRTEPPTINLKEERIKYWLNHGAQVSDTVKNILIDKGILSGQKAKPKGIRKNKKKGESEAEEGEQAAAEKTADENASDQSKAENQTENKQAD